MRAHKARRCAVLCLASTFSSASIGAANLYPINLERQTLLSALSQLGRQVEEFEWGFSIDADHLIDEIVAPLKGYYTARQAAEELLRETDIQYEWVNGNRLVITGKKVESIAPPLVSEESPPKLEEITVVGSHIRGSNPAAPVARFDREDIQNSGLATTQEFLGSLPQFFGGGAIEGVIADIKGEGAKFNLADANGVNLHGIGYDTTLVLLNGRRITPVGNGDVVDVSGIPLSAIERIDVMMDGASAIYGSDAVGGVVNITLRRSYQGMETQLGYGDVTTGSHESYRFGQTLGEHWASGNVLFSYAFQQRANLSTADRPATENVAGPSDILGEQSQHNAMFSASRQLTERAGVYMDALYSTRETEQNQANFGRKAFFSRTVKQHSLVGGGDIDLGNSWRMDTSVLYSGSSTVSDEVATVNTINKTALETWVLDSKVDGEILDAWGGAVKLALGGQYRREAFTYETESIIRLGKEKSGRDISAVFAELSIPLTGENNHPPWLNRLELTLADRHERYSDFGDSTNPKAGLLWSPVSGLTLRATYSKSFRAPLLYELSAVANPPQASILPFPDQNGVTPTLFIQGHNAQLQPENAVNRTFGIDVAPAAWPGFHLELTYFSIDFTDRIQTAFKDDEVFDALVDPRYRPRVIRNPDRELIDFWKSQSYFVAREGISSGEVGAVIDNRLHNIATMRERGIDFTLGYAFDTEVGEFAFRLSGTYLLTLENQATEASPVVDILDTPYNPVALKLRNSVSWRRDGLAATAFINYTGGYRNTNLGQKRNVDDWTTMDLSIRYPIKRSENFWWRDTAISLSVNNLFDKQPPFVANGEGYNFDATNASALGRRISLDIVKKW